MKDSRLSNRNPKCTILESFDGMIMVVGPNIVKSNHKEMKEAFDFIEKSYWEINISHLHGRYGLNPVRKGRALTPPSIRS
jgi:hypothetical protein